MFLLKQSCPLLDEVFYQIPKELLIRPTKQGTQYLDIRTSKLNIVGCESEDIVFLTFRGFIEVSKNTSYFRFLNHQSKK